MHLWRIHQCLLSAGAAVDEIGSQIDDESDKDPLMMEISMIVEEQTLDWISEKLHELSGKVEKEALNIKDQIRKSMESMAKKKRKQDEEHEASEESRKTHDEEVSAMIESKPSESSESKRSKKRKHTT